MATHSHHHHKIKKKSFYQRTHDLNYRVITAEQPLSVAAENYRRIKVSLSFSDADSKLQVIQINSATQGEGKTTALLNLAATYVEDGLKVLLVDLDLRRPKLHRSIKIKNRDGITDVLTDKITLDKAIKKSDFGFDVLNSGSKTNFPMALLGSKAIEEMFVELRKKYDIILVDDAPILSVSDSVVVSRLCDGTIFVVSQRQTKKGVAREAVNVLRQNNVKLLGVVFSELSKANSSYYKYYYESYGPTETSSTTDKK